MVNSNSILVVTGEKWVGFGLRSFSSIVREMIESAERSIFMTAFIISDMVTTKSIFNSLEKGVSVYIYIFKNESLNNTEAFKKIMEVKKSGRYPYLHVELISSMLHAKVLVVDEKNILIGSANPTFGGMIKNYELGIKIYDVEKAHRIIDLLKELEH